MRAARSKNLPLKGGKILSSGLLHVGVLEAVTSFNTMAYLGVREQQDLASQAHVAVVDLTNLTSPTVLTPTQVLSATQALATEGSRLYRLDARGRLDIYSLAIPQSPALLGGIDVPTADSFNFSGSATRHLAVAGGIAYVSLADGVRVVDLRDLTALSLGPVFGTGIGSGQVALTNGLLALVGDDVNTPHSVTSIFQVYQLNAALAPTLLAQRIITSYRPPLTAADGRFVLAEGGGGAVIYALFRQNLYLPLVTR